MQYTRNYNLKKPDYTDFADIEDINDNMDKLDEELAAPTGDSADSTTTFTTSDTADGGASSWTTVPALASGETHKSLFAKISQMFKNIRFLYKLLGTTDISSIGNGTVTGVLSSLNDSFQKTVTSETDTGNGKRISRIVYDTQRTQFGFYSQDAGKWTYVPLSEATGNALAIRNIVYDSSIQSLAINVYGGGWHYIRVSS